MTKPCAIDGCERRAIKRGWCEMHYVRWWTHGDPLTLLRPQKHLKPCSIEAAAGRRMRGDGVNITGADGTATATRWCRARADILPPSWSA